MFTRQRHDPVTMLDNPIVQLALELIRALIVDELSGHVRRGISRLLPDRPAKHSRLIILMKRRQRDGLLHRLRTGRDADP
jgi:hypothetical protein